MAPIARDFEQDLRMLYLEAYGGIRELTQVFVGHTLRVEGGEWSLK